MKHVYKMQTDNHNFRKKHRKRLKVSSETNGFEVLKP